MSKKHVIYVDGQEGTTGLRIHEMLAPRADLDVLRIGPEKRKDPAERARLINEADLVFLCLPDAASREAVSLVRNPATRIIDASTAFRTNPAWVYGLPELVAGHRERIRSSLRVANPGCHATAFILLVRPLVDAGIVSSSAGASATISATSITGFSGGGKSMIDQYEGDVKPGLLAPRPYALGLTHKHLPEMTQHARLGEPPIFMPIVGPFFQGLTVSVPLMGASKGFAQKIHACLERRYENESFVRVLPLGAESNLEAGFFDTQRCNHTNRADLFVFGNGTGQVVLMACIDNLGKGASGAAVQNMNLMLGCEEARGLSVT